jgi:rfaE bifunctional protein kinase chain/domain
VSIAPYKKILSAFAGKRVVVLGDMVLDEYVYGSTERISREAPVLILKHEKTVALPGGGANPASNIHSLGGVALPVGVLGMDLAGERLIEIFRAKGLDTSGLVTEAERDTSRKTRVLAGSTNTARQQVIRVDYSTQAPPVKSTQKRLVEALERRLHGAQGLIVSDYGDGVMGEELLRFVNSLKRRFPKLVICVDSRYQLARYKHVTVITPNETEAAPAAGFEEYREADLNAIGKKLLGATKADMALVTRGSKGMSLFQGAGAKRRDIGVYGSTQIVDVNGAGDSVAAAMTLALTAGAKPAQAMEIANAAGAVAVMQAGPASVTREQILTVLKNR